MFNNYLVLF